MICKIIKKIRKKDEFDMMIDEPVVTGEVSGIEEMLAKDQKKKKAEAKAKKKAQKEAKKASKQDKKVKKTKSSGEMKKEKKIR